MMAQLRDRRADAMSDIAYVVAMGDQADALRSQAILASWGIDNARSGNSRIVVWVSTKKHLTHSPIATEVARTGRIATNVTLRRTATSNSVVIAFWPEMKDLLNIQRSGFRALAAVVEWEGLASEWLESNAGVDLASGPRITHPIASERRRALDDAVCQFEKGGTC